MIDSAFELYSENGIELVPNEAIAEASGHGVATLYRYFGDTATLVVETAGAKWEEYFSVPACDENQSSAEMLTAFLDSFVALYRNHKDLFRFTAFFTTYVVAHKVENLEPYEKVVRKYKDYFRRMYEKGDGTIDTSEDAEGMFDTIYNMMLGVAMRYALEGEGQIEKVKEAVEKMYVK